MHVAGPRLLVRYVWRCAMKILLIEDNAADALMVRELLHDAGDAASELTHARRLDEAIRVLRGQTFDAVLLDLGLPDARGLQALGLLEQAAPDVPIVVLSGDRDEM